MSRRLRTQATQSRTFGLVHYKPVVGMHEVWGTAEPNGIIETPACLPFVFRAVRPHSHAERRLVIVSARNCRVASTRHLILLLKNSATHVDITFSI
jgi:hypothetical protein